MKTIRSLALAAALMLAPAAVPAQTGPAGALNALTGGSEPAPAAAAAVNDEARLADLVHQREVLQAEAQAAPKRIAELEAELRRSPDAQLVDWTRRLPSDADAEVLEALLEQERVQTGQLRAQMQALTTALGNALAGDPEAADRAAARSLRLAELQRQQSAPAADGAGADPAIAAAKAADAAELRRLQAEQDLEQTRQEFAGSRQRLQELELRALGHRLAAREPREVVLQRRIAELGRARLRAVVESLEATAAAIPPGDALARREAAANLDLGRELLSENEALARDRERLVEQGAALDRDRDALGNARIRLDLGSRSEQIGIWLWAELRQLEPDRRVREELDAVRDDLAELRLRLIAIDELQAGLADLRGASDALRRQPAGAEEPAEAATAAGALEEIIGRRRGLAEQLEPLLWRRIATLDEIERDMQLRLQANRELRLLFARHLLWIRSHPPVDAAWWARIPEGVRDLVKPSRFATTSRLVRDDVVAAPLPWLGAIAALVLLVALRRRAPARIDEFGQTIRDVRKDRYRRTLLGLAWTVVAAAPWPMALLIAGGLLRDVGVSGKFSDSLGAAMIGLAPALATFVFLHWLVRERGVAHAHFRWTRQRRDGFRRWVRWFGPPLLAAYAIVLLAFARNQDLAVSVLGRIGVVAAMLAWAAGTYWLLAPDRGWHTRQSTEPSRPRQLLRIGVPLGCVAAAWLALDGYVYSAALLAKDLFATFSMLVAVMTVVGLLARWFVLGARRLAMKRFLEKRAEEAGGGALGGDGDVVPAELQEEIPLEKIDAHSRALVRVVRLSLLTVGLVLIWGQVLLALFRFDEVPLWSVAGTGADGNPIREQITLLGALAGALVLWLTTVAARNLPGLIEIGLQSRGSVDAASRYAITSVSRYAIVVIGFVVGLGELGLRWSQLQWMAAALTLGLGFGLQEIFANFVSGLILLFERPFRVGDTITVNNLDGTVTRIRTRATTILDFDNKEIVVPNKAFITGQLVNWTLTDETTRITIKVGVDYGSDAALVHRLLRQAAAENPRVLQERTPQSWLMNFGTNAIEFELRVFVATMEDRLIVRNEIGLRLIELFEANGIGFAFPQLDLHLRHGPVAAPAADERKSRK